MWRGFIDGLLISGKLTEPNYGVTWTAPKYLSVDPYKDAQADEKRLAMGTLHLFDAISAEGHEPRAYLKTRKRIDDFLSSLGLTFEWENSSDETRDDDNSEAAASLHVSAGDGGQGKPNGRSDVLFRR
jgi:hypothetical protein